VNDPGAYYTPAELEFLRAVMTYQKSSGRKFLTHVDYLRIAADLGYTRNDAAPGERSKEVS
jgi:hypothetical protein